MTGKKLIEELKNATGLPTNHINKELSEMMRKFDIEPEHLTVEDLRKLMANYLQDVITELQSDKAS